MIEIFLKGGFMMWPLLIASIMVVAIIIDRFLYFRAAEVDERKFFIGVKDKLRSQGPDAAIAYTEEVGGPIAAIMKAGLNQFGQDRSKIEEFFEREALIEFPRMKRFLPALHTIGNVATLMGFTGTVLGMIKAFNSIALAGTTSPSIVAGGIGEALITTAMGLVVALFAVVFYHYFNQRAERIILEAEKASLNLLDIMEEEHVSTL
ncbi:MAG: MotA/TolQ/ExbB proton channel family protein [Elusimicrobia bacterium]|nr:MotA/TolQ/ExbB proton channel family protein [Elusimicrobiota bacterium]